MECAEGHEPTELSAGSVRQWGCGAGMASLPGRRMFDLVQPSEGDSIIMQCFPTTAVRLPTLPITWLAAIAVAILAIGSSPALGQSQETAPLSPRDVTPAELQAFAEATIRVDQVASRWNSALEQAESDAEAQEIRRQANEELTETVRDSGVGVEKYNDIYDLMLRDPEIAQQIEDYRQDAMQ